MFAHTKCDAVLVSRGTMGQPWIAQDILRALDGLDPLPRSVGDLRDSLLEHFDCIVRYQPEKQSLLDMRRVGCWYLKRLVGVKELRVLLNRSSSTAEVFQHLDRFSWESTQMNQEPVFAESEC
jgi:tRNA-dihydrouridine synthase